MDTLFGKIQVGNKRLGLANAIGRYVIKRLFVLGNFFMHDHQFSPLLQMRSIIQRDPALASKSMQVVLQNRWQSSTQILILQSGSEKTHYRYQNVSVILQPYYILLCLVNPRQSILGRIGKSHGQQETIGQQRMEGDIVHLVEDTSLVLSYSIHIHM